jgi:hypothetical protein
MSSVILLGQIESTACAGQAAILFERDVEMRSDWGNKLAVAWGWLVGAAAAVVVAALVYLLRR